MNHTRTALLALTLLTLLAPPACPAQPTTGIFEGEVLRRGSQIEYIDGPIQGNDPYAVPKDDTDLWNITLISRDPDVLKKWRSTPSLLAWSNPGSKRNWSHLHVYNPDQDAWRFTKIKYDPTATTVIVQPPLNGTCGSPTTVVCQTTLGDPEATAKKLGAAIRAYTKKRGGLFRRHPRPRPQPNRPNQPNQPNQPSYTNQPPEIPPKGSDALTISLFLAPFLNKKLGTIPTVAIILTIMGVYYWWRRKEAQ